MLFNQYLPPVKAVQYFLKLLRVNVNANSVNETLQNHPDWPGLLCVSDVLHEWNIPNAAVKVQGTEVDELPLPFIAYLSHSADPMVVVTALNSSGVRYYAPAKGNEEVISREAFLNKTEGVYLIAEPNEQSGEKNYSVKKQQSLLASIGLFSLVLLLLTASFFGLQTIFRDSSTVLWAGYIQYALYVAGVVVTSLLLWYEVDRNNPFLSKVCTGLAKGNCEAILTGSQAKFLGWLSWSEIGFSYFMGSLFALLFVSDAISVLSWLSLLAMPYILFSVGYQWLVAKQWCALCLAVQALLLLSGINVLLGHTYNLLPYDSFSGFFFMKIISCFLIPLLLWFLIKPYCKKIQQSVEIKREYLRLKFNRNVFDGLLQESAAPASELATDEVGITIGNADAPYTLIKVCNPFCGPCSRAHPKVNKMLEDLDNLKVKIIFSVPPDDTRGIKEVDDAQDELKQVTSHLMALAAKGEEDITRKMLNDWYLSPQKDYSVFAAKYPLNGELKEQGARLDAMARWCAAMKVTATPTYFLNGRKLPDVYDVEDLNYFLME